MMTILISGILFVPAIVGVSVALFCEDNDMLIV